jgi:stress-induced morphogen
MSLDQQDLEARIIDTIKSASVRINNIRGDGKYYEIYVISEQFAGKTIIEQHRMVYDSIQDLICDTTYNLSLKTAVPEGQ